MRCFFRSAFLWMIVLGGGPLMGGSQPDFFLDPKPISEEEFGQELRDKVIDMCWQFGKDSHFRFIAENEVLYFEVYLGALPPLYTDFISRVRDRCIHNEPENQLVFSYELNRSGVEKINAPRSPSERGHPDGDSYLVAERRVLESKNPKSMVKEELIELVKQKKVLFYTGAGLSLASDVPAMSELNELLGLEEGERFLLSLENGLDDPRAFVEKIELFYEACLFSAPTNGHLALKDLALRKGIRIVTENLDSLHEATGIYPYRIDPHQLRSEIGAESLAQFEYVICVGLSFDDRGFLGWYKEKNPRGKIVAVDLKQPSYLGDEDYWVIGDVQQIVPALLTTK